MTGTGSPSTGRDGAADEPAAPRAVPSGIPLKRLCEGIGPGEAASAAATTLADLMSRIDPADHEQLPGALKVLLPRLSQADAVGLLRRPTCVGPARQAVLLQLGRRAGRELRTVWEAAAWAARQAAE
jgi:hypothetical protein